MYNATPAVWTAWLRLFGRVFDELGLDIVVIDHGWPDPIEALWQRPDLCCTFMCGWPFIRSTTPMQAIAAPVPSLAAYAGQARYRSEFLVRADDGVASLESTFGKRIGWTTDNSQSGFNAPRRHLAEFAASQGGALFLESVGPLGTPARSLAALRNGTVDVIAMDSYYLDLLRLYGAEPLADVVSIAATAWTPIPLLVASPGVSNNVVDRIRAKLIVLHEEDAYRELLASLALQGFVVPDLAAYAELENMAQRARELAYQMIA